MKIYVTDKETIYVYTITTVETVAPDRVDVINDILGQKQSLWSLVKIWMQPCVRLSKVS